MSSQGIDAGSIMSLHFIETIYILIGLFMLGKMKPDDLTSIDLRRKKRVMDIFYCYYFIAHSSKKWNNKIFSTHQIMIIRTSSLRRGVKSVSALLVASQRSLRRKLVNIHQPRMVQFQVSRKAQHCLVGKKKLKKESGKTLSCLVD